MTARILIVEDEVVLRKHLARLFVRAGYEVATAGSRAEALDRLGRAPFEALLLDMKLPDGDGLDLLAALGDRQPRQTVLMTAFSTPESDRRAQRLRVCRILRKPLDLMQLVGAVQLGRQQPGCILQLCHAGERRDCAPPQKTFLTLPLDAR